MLTQPSHSVELTSSAMGINLKAFAKSLVRTCTLTSGFKGPNATVTPQDSVTTSYRLKRFVGMDEQPVLFFKQQCHGAQTSLSTSPRIMVAPSGFEPELSTYEVDVLPK